MLCIPDSNTNTWIANQISQLGYSASWIGYSDLRIDGNYEWVSGCSSSYTNWDNGLSSNDCVYISSSESKWYTTDDSDSTSFTCSCEYSISNGRTKEVPSLSPSSFTLSPLQQTNYNNESSRSGYNSSAIIGIVVGCVVFVIILILILIYFFCKRTNQVCISTINESPNDQAYTDITPTCPPPDDDNNADGAAPVSSLTEELQAVAANDYYYNNDVPMDHEKELLHVAVQVRYGIIVEI